MIVIAINNNNQSILNIMNIQKCLDIITNATECLKENDHNIASEQLEGVLFYFKNMANEGKKVAVGLAPELSRADNQPIPYITDCRNSTDVKFLKLVK